MKYEQKSFTVPASTAKVPVDCRHGWIDHHGKCALIEASSNAEEGRTQAAGADMSAHDCLHHGHVWREAPRPEHPVDYSQRPLYARHRKSAEPTVDVFCQHCPATATLARSAGFSGIRRPGQPIDTTIPPQFQQVLDRALIEASSNAGSVPKP